MLGVILASLAACASADYARELGRCDVVCWMTNPKVKSHAKSAEKDASGRTGCECVEGAVE